MAAPPFNTGHWCLLLRQARALAEANARLTRQRAGPGCGACDLLHLLQIGEESGGMGIRTPDILLAKQVLYQLSYTPFISGLVEVSGFEPLTFSLRTRRSTN